MKLRSLVSRSLSFLACAGRESVNDSAARSFHPTRIKPPQGSPFPTFVRALVREAGALSSRHLRLFRRRARRSSVTVQRQCRGVLPVSPSIGFSNPSLRNGTLCLLRPRSSLVLVRCPRSVKTPLCVCLVQNIFRCYVVVAAPQLPPFSFFMSRPEWKQNYDVLSSSLVNSNPKYSKPYNFAIIEVYDNHRKTEIQQFLTLHTTRATARCAQVYFNLCAFK